MIKEHIENFYRNKFENKGKQIFYVTDAGKCPRQIYFSLKGYPRKEPDPRLLRIFEHGDHTHMRIMSVLFSLGLVKACEVEIPKNDLLHGRADAIISIDGIPYVVEIKSVNAFKFKNEIPEPDHIKQLQLYLHFFKIKEGILLYENKDTQELKEFIIKYDEETVKELLKFFSELKKNVEESRVPDIPPNIEDRRCQFCPYLEVCEKIEEEKRKSEKS